MGFGRHGGVVNGRQFQRIARRGGDDGADIAVIHRPPHLHRLLDLRQQFGRHGVTASGRRAGGLRAELGRAAFQNSAFLSRQVIQLTADRLGEYFAVFRDLALIRAALLNVAANRTAGVAFVGAGFGRFQLLEPFDLRPELVMIGHHGVELALDLGRTLGGGVILDFVKLRAGVRRDPRLLLAQLLDHRHIVSPLWLWKSRPDAAG